MEINQNYLKSEGNILRNQIFKKRALILKSIIQKQREIHIKSERRLWQEKYLLTN